MKFDFEAILVQRVVVTLIVVADHFVWYFADFYKDVNVYYIVFIELLRIAAVLFVFLYKSNDVMRKILTAMMLYSFFLAFVNLYGSSNSYYGLSPRVITNVFYFKRSSDIEFKDLWPAFFACVYLQCIYFAHRYGEKRIVK